MNSYGGYLLPNGEHYIGEFLKDKKHGYGTFKLLNGSVYKGNWKENLMDG